MSELLTRDEERWAHEHLTHCTSALGQGRARKVLAAIDAIRAALGMPDASVEECIGRIRALCESDKRFTQAADMFRHREDVNCNLLTDLADKESQLAAAQAREKAYRATLTSARNHVKELREAWERGCISEHDGLGGTRSNRNADVDMAIHKALTQSSDTSALEAEIEKRTKDLREELDVKEECNIAIAESMKDQAERFETQLAKARRDTEREKSRADSNYYSCERVKEKYELVSSVLSNADKKRLRAAMQKINERHEPSGPELDAAMESAKQEESLPWEPLEEAK